MKEQVFRPHPHSFLLLPSLISEYPPFLLIPSSSIDERTAGHAETTARLEREEEDEDKGKEDEDAKWRERNSRVSFGALDMVLPSVGDSRIDPRNNHQTLDDVASGKTLRNFGARDLVGQCGRRSRTDDEQDEGDGEEDKVREDAEEDGTGGEEEAEQEEDCDRARERESAVMFRVQLEVLNALQLGNGTSAGGSTR